MKTKPVKTFQGKRVALSPNKWSKKDRYCACKEGWNIFLADEGLQIQKVDEKAVFETDVDAWLFVCNQADENKPLHSKALTIIKDENPEEYKRIIQMKNKKQKVVIQITGGAAHLVSSPKNISVEIRDYDIEGVEGVPLKKDKDGEEYQSIKL